ncbi:hypothetical protein [Parasitella parasitica]|uniref:PPPDE domain-containing protein n=1 Tax=Parasitella parasitica TaxID=35722 RepID=A0A0B7NEH7_9FUNG|nr:hypothetical protein [Parasitella parasitica]
MPETVKLYVYDLSQGMARSMSMQLTGKQIDGIWHTSVVVFGQEFYFGQGIMASKPGTTHHGRPLQMIDIGETFLPLEVVVEYIDSLRSVYTAEKYHLLDFNCNTFSNELCQFLCGKTIPNHITDLPTEFLDTPFGQSILPMIENMFGQSKLTSGSNNSKLTTPQPSAEVASLVQGMSSAATSAAPTTVNPVQIAHTAAVVDGFISSYKAVIVFFTSASCPPCKVIKPDFITLIQEKNSANKQIKILGVIMDTSLALDAAKYRISVTPTFQLFLNGQKYSEFKGANYAELKSQVDILLFEAFPPHPHRKILLRTIVDQPNVPILYTLPGKWDMIYAKLNTFLEKENITLDAGQKSIFDQSKRFLEKTNSTLNMDQWKTFVDSLLQKLSVDQLFPLFDIFRSLLISETVSDFYVNDPSQIVTIMEIASNNKALAKATWLMILKIACNIFANTTLSTIQFTSNLTTSHRAQLSQLLVSSLLASNAQVRQAAASLAYNCSTCIAIERLEKEKGTFSGMAEQEDDDWEVELASAIINALSKETDEEITHRLLAAIGKFVFLAPKDTSSVADLLSALDINSVIEEKKATKVISSSKVLGLARDICEMIKQQ